VRGGAQDVGLEALYFNFGRYLLIASSRPGTMPANLQGIWNRHIMPPWNSDYHLNINLQMNYWPAEVCNLGECHLPLFDWMESTLDSGRRTAQVHYGCRGYVMHHVSDPWGFTAPADAAHYGLWPVGGAWLCDHLWEHFRFSGDREFLVRRAYPFMKENALFFLDYLVEDEQGRLVSGPSMSPEHNYRLSDGTVGTICMAPAMDIQIIRSLFNRCIAAGTLLDVDEELRARLEAAREKLPTPRIGAHGQLQEWPEDWQETDPGHRHMSQLYALHPGDQITINKTPELARAARRTLERRLEHGGGHTGWSAAWIISFWTRLNEAEPAHQMLQTLLSKSTYNNLLDAHPPFQIDGNFGGTAGIAEMLLQSHETRADGTPAGCPVIHLLPTLPLAWNSGHLKGFRARGGFEIEMQWRERELTHATLRSLQGQSCLITYNKDERMLHTEAGQSYDLLKILDF
jgi:alpha-L-fucosidase 2